MNEDEVTCKDKLMKRRNSDDGVCQNGKCKQSVLFLAYVWQMRQNIQGECRMSIIARCKLSVIYKEKLI